MATFPLLPQKSDHQSSALLGKLWRVSPFLSVMVILFALSLVVSVVMSLFVSTEIDNSRIWFKPVKFSISVLFYCLTLLWILSLGTRWRLLGRIICFIVGANLLFDLAWVLLQSFRGVRSHFNNATAFDNALYNAVGMSINLVIFMNVIAIIFVLAQRLEDKPLKWSLVFGLIATIVGGFSAIPMTFSTPAQEAAEDRGGPVDVVGAHSVGVEDGGPGLPLLGWSTEGGDLRVNHFVGLHGLQMVPLLGVFIKRRWGNTLSSGRRSSLVITAGLGYIGFTLLLMWQALRGQSVIAPDGLTLTAFAGLGAVVTLIYAIIIKSQPANRHIQAQV